MNNWALRVLVLLAAFAFPVSAQTVIPVGVFPNITHPQGMAGKANGWVRAIYGKSRAGLFGWTTHSHKKNGEGVVYHVK